MCTPLKRFETSLGRPNTSRDFTKKSFTLVGISQKIALYQPETYKQLFGYRTVALIKRTSLERFAANLLFVSKCPSFSG